MTNQIIKIGKVEYTIIKREAVTSPNTKMIAHTKLFLRRGNGRNIYTAFIRNDDTITRVVNNGVRY